MNKSQQKLAVIGLGYVGLPVAVEFGCHYEVLGYDISEIRINELQRCHDRNLEYSSEQIAAATGLKFIKDTNELTTANVYIITVPTPIDTALNPDLGPICHATKLVGSFLKAGDIVIFESTVFPGATEEVCVPLLEEFSGLKYKYDFFCGYSRERINPGDK